MNDFPALRSRPLMHADGIYFDLPEEEYHADPALGSSNMKELAFAPCDYWYGSWMNPQRPPDEDTPAQKRGSAIHVLAFHGEDEFDRRYMRGPDQLGMSSAEKTASTKAGNKEAAALGLTMLPALEYDRIAIVCKKVMTNPYLSVAFSGGAAEVSVFWTDVRGEGSRPIRKKARLDYVKPRGVGDLKSVINQFRLPFPRACINAITNYHYEIQARHYLDARARMPAMIRAGQVHGGVRNEEFAKLLQGIVDAPRFAWQWVFWQSDRAPITWSRVLSPGNPMLETAASEIRGAEANYLAYLEYFGTDEPWLENDVPAELFQEDMPPWFGRDEIAKFNFPQQQKAIEK